MAVGGVEEEGLGSGPDGRQRLNRLLDDEALPTVTDPWLAIEVIDALYYGNSFPDC